RSETRYDQTYSHLRNRSLSSPKGVALTKALNEPCSRISFAALMKPPQAARAKAPPTEMRRTPRSASWETVRSQLFVETSTLTGFGETVFTIVLISSGLLTPGA